MRFDTMGWKPNETTGAINGIYVSDVGRWAPVVMFYKTQRLVRYINIYKCYIVPYAPCMVYLPRKLGH